MMSRPRCTAAMMTPSGRPRSRSGALAQRSRGGQVDTDEVNVRLRAVFADPLEAGILVHEAGRNDTGGDRHHAHAQEGD